MPRISLLITVVLALAVPPGASAAFAPKLSATITPTTPGVRAGITTVVTQALGETPQKKVVVTFPPELGLNPDSTALACSDAQEAARACPTISRLGTAKADVLAFHLVGGVFLGESSPKGIKLILLLDGGPPTMEHQTIEGLINLTPQGTQTVFDNLANVPVSRLELALDNSPRTLLATPAECGTYMILAAFTSQNGEHATAQAPFTITGCPPPVKAKPKKPRIAGVKIVPKHPRAGMKHRAKLSFRLSKAAKVRIRVTRSGHVVYAKRISGHKGTNTRILPRLRAGRYKVALTATDSGGRKGTAKLSFSVAKKKSAKPTKR
jgi:hypothetical protein